MPPTKTSNANPTRAEDFVSRYANNVHYESSVWDLKLVFGQLDQSISPEAVVQHIAVTVPWSQVKLLVYFLQLNLIAHEGHIGRVSIAPGIVGEPPITQEGVEKFGVPDQVIEQIRKHYADFILANPEAAPNK